MDPVTLATITAATTVAATEVGKGVASEAGKTLWNKLCVLFDWKTAPTESELAPAIARKLLNDEQLTRQVLELLQSESTGAPSALVHTINAEKVVVANEIKVNTLNM